MVFKYHSARIIESKCKTEFFSNYYKTTKFYIFKKHTQIYASSFVTNEDKIGSNLFCDELRRSQEINIADNNI